MDSSPSNERTSLVGNGQSHRPHHRDPSSLSSLQHPQTYQGGHDLEEHYPLRAVASSHPQCLGRRVNLSVVAIALWCILGTFVLVDHYHHRVSSSALSVTSSPFLQPQIHTISSLIYPSATESNVRITFRFNASLTNHTPVTGRLLFCLAKQHADEIEPRFLIGDYSGTQQLFAVDVFGFHGAEQLNANHDDNDLDYVREINSSAFGFPVLSFSDIPEDDYWVQGVLQPYQLYNRSDNFSLWLPRLGTFEHDNGVLTSPGTLFSTPQLVHFSQQLQLSISIDQIEPEQAPLPTTEYLQHVEFRSDMLSKFWGTDIFLKAWVLLPFEWASHPDVKYPLFIYHSHYSEDFEFGFEEAPPQPESDFGDFGIGVDQEALYGYYFYRNWTGQPFEGKRGIVVQIQHANPYYDDSYAVNSANLGPYGDAITYEFIPYIEQEFRGIGEGWARTMYGGSTGGWESFAVQVFYPKEYNGCWSFCPDSFDFRKFQIVDLIHDDNAYYSRGDWTIKRRGSVRNYLGQIIETMDEENHHEMVLGSRGRSGGQWDIWQAVYGPVDQDGYPAAIWDKLTGEINHTIVEYWEDHFDIRKKLEREWDQIGADLVNKLHVYVGVTDSYYLNDHVYILEDFLEKTSRPYYNGSIEYGVSDGRGFEHCWTGAYDESLQLAWNTLNVRMLPQMIQHILDTAPPGADLSFTSY